MLIEILSSAVLFFRKRVDVIVINEITEAVKMASQSGIEWTEQTWNPVTGCTKVSPGCKNCYAETMARRLQAMGVPGYESGFRKVTLVSSRLDQPIKRKRPTVYFVNSMSDLFHEEIPFEYIDRVFETISSCKHHTFQILTKRPERMLQYFRGADVPENVWVGVSVEDREYGVPRIKILKKIQAKIRFLSVEPLLEDIGRVDLRGISWVIVGGESGAGARPMKPSWVERIRDQCKKQKVGFFFKQWGAWGEDGVKRAKSANGRVLDGKIWNEIPVIEVVRAD